MLSRPTIAGRAYHHMNMLNAFSIRSVHCSKSGIKCQRPKQVKEWRGSAAGRFPFDPMTLTD